LVLRNESFRRKFRQVASTGLDGDRGLTVL
jgi:hypothetical protein